MKRILLSMAFVLGTAGLAAAQDPDTGQMRALVQQELTEYGADVSVDQLTDEQVAELFLYATSIDSESVRHDAYRRVLAEAETGERPRSRVFVLSPLEGDEDVAEVGVNLPRNQLRSLVAQTLATYEEEVDVSTLTDEQLAGIFTVANSGVSESEQHEQIRAILQQ